MVFLELLLLFASVIIVFFALLSIVLYISNFYRDRYGFSVWSGILILFFSFVIFLIYSASHDGILIAVPVILCVYTFIQDIRLSGWLHGILAFLFQTIITLFLVFIIIILISHMIIQMLTKRTLNSRKPYTQVFHEIHYGIILFPVFIRL